MPRPLFTPGKDLVPIVQEAGWAPGTVWTGAENLAPTEFDPRTVQAVASRYNDYAAQPTGKAVSTTYSKTVFVALYIQHAITCAPYYIAFCGLSDCAIFSPHITHKRHDFL
jgi:hypothetical protein